MLTVRNTRVISFIGNAFTVVTMPQTARGWTALDRSLAGPRNWQRLGGLIHRHDCVSYSVRLHTTPQPIECVSMWLEYNSKTNGGELTIHLPQTIGPSDVPIGTNLEILDRQWVATTDGPIHKSNWHPDLLQYASCTVAASDWAPVEPHVKSGG